MVNIKKYIYKKRDRIDYFRMKKKKPSCIDYLLKTHLSVITNVRFTNLIYIDMYIENTQILLDLLVNNA